MRQRRATISAWQSFNDWPVSVSRSPAMHFVPVVTQITSMESRSKSRRRTIPAKTLRRWRRTSLWVNCWNFSWMHPAIRSARSRREYGRSVGSESVSIGVAPREDASFDLCQWTDVRLFREAQEMKRCWVKLNIWLGYFEDSFLTSLTFLFLLHRFSFSRHAGNADDELSRRTAQRRKDSSDLFTFFIETHAE